MLMAMLILLLTGGDPTALYKKNAKEVILDEARQEQVLSMIKEIQSLQNENQKTLQELQRHIDKFNRGQSKDESYEEIQRQAENLLKSNLKQFLDLREELKALVTKDEWGEIFIDT